MHEDIIEHISDDSGYKRGFDSGMKYAWDILGDLAESYKKGMITDGQPNVNARMDARNERIKTRVLALEYGRYAIQEGMHNGKRDEI